MKESESLIFRAVFWGGVVSFHTQAALIYFKWFRGRQWEKVWWGNGVSERVNLLCLSLMFVCVFFPLLHRRLSRQAHRDDHRGNMSTSNISLPSKRDSKGSFFKVCVTLSSQKHPYKQSCAQHASGRDCPSLSLPEVFEEEVAVSITFIRPWEIRLLSKFPTFPTKEILTDEEMKKISHYLLKDSLL